MRSSNQVYTADKNDTLKLRKQYWDYVKKCLFGNPEDSTRGLIDINVLTDKDLKEITSLIFSDLPIEDEESFFSRVSGVGCTDKNDIFCPENKEKLASDVIKSFNKQNMSNSKKRLITGIILLSLGIILFVVTLVIGLKSIIVVALFFLSLTMVTIGVTCLFLEKIDECSSSCYPQIKSNTVDKSLVDIHRGSNKELKIQIDRTSEKTKNEKMKK